jgi:CTP-dependent riboflavin kinase
MTVAGRVAKGIGVSSSFLSILCVKGQMDEAPGFSPYSGTLNIDVGHPAVREAVIAVQGITAGEWSGGH